MALSANRNSNYVPSGMTLKFPVDAADVIYRGALVGLDADGYVRIGADASGLLLLGVAVDEVSNSAGADGDVSVEVDIGGALIELTHTAGSQAQANVGDMVYMDGDDACDVIGNVTNITPIGRIVKITSATKVWVQLFPHANAYKGLIAADITALTDSTTGSATNTCDDTTASVKDDLASIIAKVNALIALVNAMN